MKTEPVTISGLTIHYISDVLDRSAEDLRAILVDWVTSGLISDEQKELHDAAGQRPLHLL